MISSNKSISLLYGLLSSLLAIGAYVPFFGLKEIGNLGVYIICIFIFTYLILKGLFWKILIKFRVHFLLLFSILILLFYSSFFYSLQTATGVSFNFKFLAAILFYCVSSYYFLENRRVLINCVLIYSITLSIVALLTQLGFWGDDAVLEKGRLILFNENPNSYSIRAVLALFSMIYLIFENPLSWSKIRFALLLLFPSLIYLVLVSGSRGSFVIFIMGVLLFTIFSPISFKFKTLVFIIMFIAFLFMSVYIINNDYLYDRLIVSTYEGQLAGRGDIWNNALDIFKDNIWLGVGEIGYLREMYIRFSETRDAHNLFIYLLTCSGLMGVILFLSFVFSLLLNAMRARKESVFPLTILIAVILLMAKTGGVLTYLVMWYFIAIVNALSFHRRKI